jgi:hypothetical protein
MAAEDLSLNDRRPEAFIQWALDPARTIEEQYVVECMLPHAVGWWRHQQKLPALPSDYKENQAKKKLRKLNPAYRPTLNPEEVKCAAHGLDLPPNLDLGDSDDRPVRTLAGAQFATGATYVRVHGEGVSDWSPLGALPKMLSLHVYDDESEEFGSLGACRQVRYLGVTANRPWPRLAGWEGMVQLEKLDWFGNLFALEAVPRLERVRVVKLEHGRAGNLPLRDATRLPEMPALEMLTLEGVNRLDGLERFAQLQTLAVSGPIRDLTPLTKLTRLTHLVVSSQELQDLTPLATLPELRYLKVIGERPLDWFVLADLPCLREVVAEDCEANVREAATLQEVLSSWDVDFCATPPRPLPPCQFKVKDDGKLPGVIGWERDALFGPEHDRMLLWSEQRWHQQRLKVAMEKLFGNVKWGRAGGPLHWDHFGDPDLNVTTFAAAMRLSEIVEAVRPLLAESRVPRSIHICVNTEPWWDWDPDEKPDPEEQAERDRQNEEYWEQKRKERAEFLERQHRWRLQQQEGGRIQPDEFAPEPEPPKPAKDEDEDDDDPPSLLEGQHLFVYGWITETGFYISKNTREDAERLMAQASGEEEGS